MFHVLYLLFAAQMVNTLPAMLAVVTGIFWITVAKCKPEWVFLSFVELTFALL